MNYCPNCGKQITETSNFCSNCGAQLSPSEAPQAPEAVQGTKERKKKKPVILIICICAAVLAVGIGLAIFLGNAAKNTPFSDSPEAIQTASESVVLLNCYDKKGELFCTGSAFAAFEDGVFVTNYHVISDEVYSAVAYTEDGMMFAIDSVVAYDEAKDVAILKTTANTNIAPLTLGDSGALEKGEKVVAIGSPLGFMNTVSTGVFSAYNQLSDMVEIQFSASISSGSSGGALFNDSGDVIGITYASYTDGQNLNVAVPVSYAADLWNGKNDAAALTLSELYDTREHIETYSASILWDYEIGFDVGTELYIDGRVAYKNENWYHNYKGIYVIETDSSVPDIDDSEDLFFATCNKTVPWTGLNFTADSSDLYNTVSVGDHIVAKCIVGTDGTGAKKIYNIESLEIIPD